MRTKFQYSEWPFELSSYDNEYRMENTIPV